MTSPSTKVSLYTLAADFAALEDQLIASGGEWTQEVELGFAALGELEADKVDGYVALIRQTEAYARACAQEQQELKLKEDTARHLIERLKSRLCDYMGERGVTELRGKLWRPVLTPNGGKAPLRLAIDDPTQLPDALVKHEISINVAAVRALAEAAEGGRLEIKGIGLVAELLPRGTHLRIR